MLSGATPERESEVQFFVKLSLSQVVYFFYAMCNYGLGQTAACFQLRNGRRVRKRVQNLPGVGPKQTGVWVIGENVTTFESSFRE